MPERAIRDVMSAASNALSDAVRWLELCLLREVAVHSSSERSPNTARPQSGVTFGVVQRAVALVEYRCSTVFLRHGR